MSANGRLTEGELTAFGGILLSNSTARAWQAMVDAAEAEAGISLTIARPAGGYRSFFVQGDMKRNPGAYGLNPASSVSLAAPGNSTHGFGTRVDIGSFSGARAAWVLANCDRFGFTREFGAADPNHFKHNGVTIGGVITTSGTSKAPAVEEEETMKLVFITVVDGKGGSATAVATDRGVSIIANEEDFKLLQRLDKLLREKKDAYSTFNTAEVTLINKYLR
jgi:hypothetical protein